MGLQYQAAPLPANPVASAAGLNIETLLQDRRLSEHQRMLVDLQAQIVKLVDQQQSKEQASKLLSIV